MFRLQQNTPEVYVNNSRDFQLFCRLYDAIQGSTKFNIDSMLNTSSTHSCQSSMLSLIGTKVGFFNELEVDDTEFRYVLQAFPIIMRNKGTRTAVQQITNLYHRYLNNRGRHPEINIDNSTQCICVYFFDTYTHSDLLIQMLKLVAPAGYDVKASLVGESLFGDTLQLAEDVKIDELTSDEASLVRSHNPSDYKVSDDKPLNDYKHTIGMTLIADNECPKKQEETDE